MSATCRDDNCSICITPLADNTVVRLHGCGHEFHLACITQQHMETCPLCRRKITDVLHPDDLSGWYTKDIRIADVENAYTAVLHFTQFKNKRAIKNSVNIPRRVVRAMGEYLNGCDAEKMAARKDVIQCSHPHCQRDFDESIKAGWLRCSSCGSLYCCPGCAENGHHECEDAVYIDL